jgi:hypothetical protein
MKLEVKSSKLSRDGSHVVYAFSVVVGEPPVGQWKLNMRYSEIVVFFEAVKGDIKGTIKDLFPPKQLRRQLSESAIEKR